MTTPDGETDEFEIFAGVLQGDTLEPYLFIITLDHCLRSAVDGRERKILISQYDPDVVGE